MKSLEKDPNERFPSVQTFATALEQAHQTVLDDSSVSSNLVMLAVATSPPSQSSRSIVERLSSWRLQREPKSRQRMLSDFPQLRRPPTWFVVALIASILLLLGGGTFAYMTVYRPYQIQAQITTTKQAHANVTAAAQKAMQDI